MPLLALGGGKLSRGVSARRGAAGRMAEWASRERKADLPLAWFHAPSVGEGLQARAVIEALRERLPKLQIAYTYFSPSAERFARSMPADFAGVLPFDAPGPVHRALEVLRCSVLVFTKSEVWPVLTAEAAKRGIPSALLSATLPPSSGRLSRAGRLLLSPAHRRLSAVGAISEEDAGRYALLGVPGELRSVMGDSRFDQVLTRAGSTDWSAPPLSLLRADGALTVVAGSTWPGDEERLIPAFATVAGGHPWLRLILAPHEPTPKGLAAAERLLDRSGLSHLRLSGVEAGAKNGASVTLVDRVGVLGDLYALADAAYVGGGFGRRGLHSVLEPAAFGVPVIFGPRHRNAREAAELVRAGGGFEVSGGAGLRATLGLLLADARARAAAGQAAAGYLQAGAGAAGRGAEIVLRLLAAPGG